MAQGIVSVSGLTSKKDLPIVPNPFWHPTREAIVRFRYPKTKKVIADMTYDEVRAFKGFLAVIVWQYEKMMEEENDIQEKERLNAQDW